MSERTGLGVVEVALLEALETSRFLRCDKALASVEERIGLAPGYAYEVLVDLARPWTMPVNLVQGQGNFGSRGNDPPANFRYTEARITRAGRAALRDETSDRSSPFGRIVCIPTPGTPPEQLREMLLDVTGVCTTMPVALSRPLPDLIRSWVQTNASEDLLASLATLEHAIPSQ